MAKSMGARLQPASGAMAGAKSDATMGDYRLEMKSTVHDTLKVERHWLNKIAYEASTSGQTPALVMSFVDGQGHPRDNSNSEWIAIPRWAFEELVGND